MAVVSLAVFFVGLTIWRVPVDAYVAVSEIGQRRVGSPARDLVDCGAIEPWGAQRSAALHQALADAIRYADARAARAEPDLSVEVSEERIRSAQSRLSIDAQALDASDHRIRISFAGPDPNWSLALVEHLTRDCLLATSSPTDSGTRSARALRNARWRLDQSRHYERKARYHVEDLMDTCFAQASGAGENSGSRETALERGSGPYPAAASTSAPVVNPQWQQLQTQLAEMSEQLQPLVTHLTPNHPLIVELSQRMEMVRAQLAATPQYLGADATQALGAVEAPGGAAAPASHVANVVEAYADDFQELRKAYEDAIGNREQAEQRLANLLARPASGVGQLPHEPRWLITPPTLQGRIGGRPSARRVGALGGLAVLCGIAMAWTLRTLHGLRRINTVTDLEQVLALPVVGQLSLDPAPRSTGRLARRSRVVRGVVTAAEVTLGLMLVVFLGGVMEQSAVSELLREDPFVAIPETVAHALEQWF